MVTLDEERTALDSVAAHVSDHNYLHARYNLGVPEGYVDSWAASSPEAEDDMFDGSSLDAKWTRVSRVVPLVSAKVGGGVLNYMKTPAATSMSEMDIMTQPYTLAVGDELQAGISIYATTGGAGNAFLGVTDGTTHGTDEAFGSRLTFDPYLVMNNWPTMLGVSANWGSTLFPAGSNTGSPPMFHMRFKRLAVSEWTAYFSRLGNNWWETYQTSDHTFSPTHIGVGMWHNGTLGDHEEIAVHYFRLVKA